MKIGRPKRTIKAAELRCAACGAKKPFDAEHFPVRTNRTFGLDTICRTCTCAKARRPNRDSAQKLRIVVLAAYGVAGVPKCVCCGESAVEFLTLDHINGGGSAERKRVGGGRNLNRILRDSGFPTGYRTLCWNCNLSFAKYGYCPHQVAKLEVA